MKKHFSPREVSQLSDALHCYITPLLQSLYPDKPVRQSGHEIRIGENGGISYDLHKRLYHNHKSGKGGDIFALIMEATGCGFYDAIKQAEAFAGGDYRHEYVMPLPAQKKPNANRDIALNIWQQSQKLEVCHD
jgi:hypothetical protein